MICVTHALTDNHTVTMLVLDSNNIGDSGAQCLACLLQDPACSIQIISLCDNSIATPGFQAFGHVMKYNKQVKFLNLSSNQADDKSVQSLANSLKDNRQLQYLNLSHNVIGDAGTTLLAAALASNDGLQTLDLSWNRIRANGSMALFASLKENITLKSLQLSMNGVGTQGAKFLGELLKSNESLTNIDVSFNRIYDEGVAHIAKGLYKNEILHHLFIHDNPVTSISATTLLHAIHTNANSAMWKLDLSSLAVVQEAVFLADEINTRTGDFVFRFKGLVNSNFIMVGNTSNRLNPRNPQALVKEYIENEGLRLIDFFKLMDKDKSGSISRDEFVSGLTTANVLLTQYQMDKLMKALDTNGDGEIDFAELIEGDRQYRNKQRQRRKQEMIRLRGDNVKDYFGYQSTT